MQTSKNTFTANVGGIIHAQTALESFSGMPSFLSAISGREQYCRLLAQFSRDILDNPIIIDVIQYAKENPKAKEIKESDSALGNYDALLFKRAQQYQAKTEHHDNHTDGYNYKDVSQLLSTVKNARSLIIHALAGAEDVGDYDVITGISSAINSINRDVESLLKVVAPWGERCDVKAISFSH